MSSFLQRFRSLWALEGQRLIRSGTDSLSPRRRAELEALSSRIGYQFHLLGILDRALTHKSFVHSLPQRRQEGFPDYENLEFLGDTILDFVISETLLLRYPDRPEGELTKMRAFLVSAKPLSRISRNLGLGQYLRLSRGEEKTGGRRKRAILADLFESLAAAIYLDGGLKPARQFILSQYESLLGEMDSQDADFRDYKTRLQECLHSHGVSGPQYLVIEETGPDHRKWFRMEVSIGNTSLATGEGSSKKRAEQEAASKALQRLSREKDLLQSLSDG